jgi:hypothetical protein
MCDFAIARVSLTCGINRSCSFQHQIGVLHCRVLVTPGLTGTLIRRSLSLATLRASRHAPSGRPPHDIFHAGFVEPLTLGFIEILFASPQYGQCSAVDAFWRGMLSRRSR